MSPGPFPDIVSHATDLPTAASEVDEEAGLVAAAVAGDQRAFRALWLRAERPAFALCLRLTGNHADAADALQETQLAAWRGLHRFAGRCGFAVWVYAIARNAALGVLRGRLRRAEVELPDGTEPAAAPFAEALVDSLAVRAALDGIPERHREALLLWVGGLSYDEVAALMGAPVNSVRVWIHRARTALRARLAH